MVRSNHKSYRQRRRQFQRQASNTQSNQQKPTNESLARDNWKSYAKAPVDVSATLKGRSTAGNQTIDSIKNLLANPITNAVNIGNQIEALYTKNGSVFRIINYFVSLLTYNYNVYPMLNAKDDFNIGNIDLKEYLTVADYIDRYNLKQYAPYFVKQALIHGVGFFYEISSQTGTVYMEFPSSMCRIATMEDGVYHWMIDVTRLNDDIVNTPGFPNEIKNAYEQGAPSGETNNRWNGDYFIVSNKGFAITFDMSVMTNGGVAISPLTSLLLDSMELDKAKENIDIKDDIDAVRVLHAKIPVDSKTGDVMMPAEEAAEWQYVLASGLPLGVAPIVTPFDTENISLVGSGNQSAYSTVSDAQKQLYKSVGVPASMFGDTTTSSNIVKISVQKDAAYMFKNIIPVLTSYYNSVLKRARTESGTEWRIKILEQDSFNSHEFSKLHKDGNTIGTSRLDYLASMGATPSEIYSKLLMEQQVLNIDSIMIPKSTSHTMSGSSSEGVGRPVTNNPTDDTDRINDSK